MTIPLTPSKGYIKLFLRPNSSDPETILVSPKGIKIIEKYDPLATPRRWRNIPWIDDEIVIGNYFPHIMNAVIAGNYTIGSAP